MADAPTTAQRTQALARYLTMDAPLAERLRRLAEDVRAESPDYMAIVERMIAHLRAAEVGAAAPQPGECMPPFVLPDQNGRLIALADILERGPAVIAFLRGHWCSYCRINADALSDLQRSITPLAGAIVAVTPDLQRYTGILADDVRFEFPVLTDLDNGYALQLGLAFRIPDELRQAMIAADLGLAPYQGNESWMLPVPATFVVGRDGCVRARFVDPDYRRRMAIEDIVAALASG